MKNKFVLKLTESAAMIALAVGLSMITVIKMPFGGSITACSMLPIILLAYRRGPKWGLSAGFVYSVLQMFLGFENLQYGTSAAAVCAIIFLDYIIAFTVLGLGGIFKSVIKNQSTALVCGSTLVCVLRYLCHVISGCTVWAGVSIPTGDGLLYSLAYNAAYMVPEAIITIAVAWYVSQLVEFGGERLAPHKRDNESAAITVCKAVGLFSLFAGITFDAVYAFICMQTEDGFDITAMKDMSLPLFGSVLLIGVLLFGVLFFIGNYLKRKKN